MSPEIFIEKVLGPLNISNLMIGDDFRFGQDRKGDFLMLKIGVRVRVFHCQNYLLFQLITVALVVLGLERHYL